MERKVFQIIKRKEISQKLQFPRGISVSKTQSHNKTSLFPIVHPQGGALRSKYTWINHKNFICTLILVCILKHALLQHIILYVCIGSQT